jgi:diguanylate cyclase (GGDEF)-like protein/PAS domain S-box-containing protein
VGKTLLLDGVAATTGVALLLTGHRLPEWVPELGVAVGTAVISLDLLLAGGAATGNAMFYVFVCIYSFHFLPLRAAFGELVFVGLTYGVVLAIDPMIGGAGKWCVTMGTLLVTGLLVAQLIAQLERWIHHARQREADLRQAEERFRSSFENAAIGMALVDCDGRWLRVNPALAEMLAYDPAQLVGKYFRDLTPPEDVSRDVGALQDMVDGNRTTYHAEKRYIRLDGQLVWVSLSVSAVRDSEGKLLHMISQMQDITARKEAEEELVNQALHDPLTGLPNRVLFGDRVQVALSRIERTTNPLSVFFIDLDRFKLVNDSLGHAIGDRMLIEIAARLQDVVRPSDTVSRFGGDEFTVLCENTDESAAVMIGERILDSLTKPMMIDRHELFAGASIGIAVSRDHKMRAESMLRDSDAAMYQAKDQGGARVVVFDGRLHLRATERLELENDLRHALERGELRLHYQPDVDLRTGRVQGVEALVRWQHPRRGLLLPGSFIWLAEESGLIVPLGEWVIREACQQAREWQDAGLDLIVSVNISPRQLADPRLPEIVASAVEYAQVAEDRLCLEITETAAVDAGAPTLSALKSSGVSLALDDFGAGFSSLHQIRRLPPVDTLKIDRSFVEQLDERDRDEAIVAAVVGMARSLEMQTVAEGIQNEDQVKLLRGLGCNRGQGFHFSRPAPAETIEKLVRAGACGELVASA